MLKIKRLTLNEFEKFNILFVQYKSKTIRVDEVINHVFNQTYIAYIDKQIVGFIIFALIYDRGELLDLYVNPNFRHRGIASTLIKKMLTKTNNCTNISLEVRKDNDIAYELYSKFGFKTVAVRERYYNGIDGYLMVKEVNKQ